MFIHTFHFLVAVGSFLSPLLLIPMVNDGSRPDDKTIYDNDYQLQIYEPLEQAVSNEKNQKLLELIISLSLYSIGSPMFSQVFYFSCLLVCEHLHPSYFTT